MSGTPKKREAKLSSNSSYRSAHENPGAQNAPNVNVTKRLFVLRTRCPRGRETKIELPAQELLCLDLISGRLDAHDRSQGAVGEAKA